MNTRYIVSKYSIMTICKNHKLTLYRKVCKIIQRFCSELILRDSLNFTLTNFVSHRWFCLSITSACQIFRVNHRKKQVVFYIQYICNDDQWLKCMYLYVLSICTYLILVQLTTPFWHSQTRQGLWAPTSPWVRFIWGHAAET